MKNGEIAAETVWNRDPDPVLVCDFEIFSAADQRIFSKSLFGGDVLGTFLVGAFSVGIDEGDFDTESTRYHRLLGCHIRRSGRCVCHAVAATRVRRNHTV